jgi:hypothetical protein
MSRMLEAHFAFEPPVALVFTGGVSGPQLDHPGAVLRDQGGFASDADYCAYLERERDAAQIRGATDLAALAAKALGQS